MNFLFHDLKKIVGLLAFFILYCLLSIWAHSTRSKSTGLPEPSGGWPILGHLPLLGGKDPIFQTFGAMADQYGPIFLIRLGYHRTLVVSSWELVKECFTTNDKIFATRPNIAAGRYLGYDNAIFSIAPYGPYWRDVRKMATLELLSSHKLEMLKHVRTSEISSYVKDLRLLCANNGDCPIEVAMGNLFERLTFNIIIRMVAGKRLPEGPFSDHNNEAWQLEKAIKKATYLFGIYTMADAIPYLEWMDIEGHVNSMKQTAKEIDSVLKIWLDEHLQSRMKSCVSDDKGDFMDAMLSSLPEDTIMSGHKRDTIIKATAEILTLTGSESISITLQWAVSLLLNNRHVLKAAQEELDIHIGQDRQVQESDIKNLKYLQAIIKETLRLYPPSPLTGIREAMEDCHVGGHYIPKGTRLLANIWKLHRDPRVWPDPNEFQPERFLTSHAGIDVKGQNFEYIPFSSGRRSCPGLNFGLQVVHLTLANLIHGFNITTMGDQPVDMQEGLGLALPKLNPLHVVVTPRLSLELYE